MIKKVSIILQLAEFFNGGTFSPHIMAALTEKMFTLMLMCASGYGVDTVDLLQTFKMNQIKMNLSQQFLDYSRNLLFAM